MPRDGKRQSVPLSTLTALICFAALLACAAGLGVAWIAISSNVAALNTYSKTPPKDYVETGFHYTKFRLFRLELMPAVCDYTEADTSNGDSKFGVILCRPQSSKTPTGNFDNGAFWNRAPGVAVKGLAITTTCLIALATLSAMLGNFARESIVIIDIVTAVLCFIAMLTAASTLGVFNRYFPVGGSKGPQCIAVALALATMGFFSALLEATNASNDSNDGGED